MGEKWAGEYLAEAVRRYNTVQAGLEEAVPLVAAALEGARVTAEWVDKRTRARVDAILTEHMPRDTWAHYHLDTSYGDTLYISAYFYAPSNSAGGVQYGALRALVAERGHPDGRPWRGHDVLPYLACNIDDITRRLAAIRAAEDAADEAQSALSAAIGMADPFWS